MFLATLASALAAPTVDGTLLAGARTAPESSVQLPSAGEGDFAPSALVSANVRLRLGGDQGAWARLELGGWGYTDLDASVATGGLGLGWRGTMGQTNLDLAGRYDAQVFPVLFDASNGRAELIGSARRAAPTWSLTGQATGIDRRFVGESGFTTGELGAVFGWSPGACGLDVGASAQVNAANTGAIGLQGRTLLRLRAGAGSWHVAVEHRLIYAADGEAERESRAAITATGDYSDDIDALSGGGFVQNRVGVSGAFNAGPWTLSAGGFARFRGAETEEEAAVSFIRTWSGQARVERAFGDDLDVFVAGGAAGATLATGTGYVDTFGWLGLDVRFPSAPPRGSTGG